MQTLINITLAFATTALRMVILTATIFIIAYSAYLLAYLGVF